MQSSVTRGYHGYHGRRPGGRRWLVVVLVLILLAAALFLFAQHYIVYENDGSYHFDWFWKKADDAQENTGENRAEDLEIVIEPPDVKRLSDLRGVELDEKALNGDMETALGAMPTGTNAVAVRLKTEKGELLYPSALSDAVEAKAAAGNSITRAAISELLSSGHYTVARLCALHDSLYSRANMVDAAVLQRTHPNYVWYAPDSSFYLAPEKEAARAYLADIAKEVAQLGFDEILLDEFTYPTRGKLENIDTDSRGMTEQEALALLADELREAVAEHGTKLSLTLDEKTVLDGKNEVAGQDVAELAPKFDRIYVPTTEDKIPALEKALEPYGAQLVPILKTAPKDGAYLLAP